MVTKENDDYYDAKLIYENDVFLRINCPDQSLYKLIYDHYSFRVPGFMFMPTYKSGYWDGFIRLFDPSTNRIYAGLKDNLINFLRVVNCLKVIEDDKFKPQKLFDEDYFKNTFLPELKLPFDPRPFQIDGLKYSLDNKRVILLSPTNSGKSLIMYLICRWLINKELIPADKKILIVVPTVQLVEQLAGDFKTYGISPEIVVHKISGGKSKTNEQAKIVITTWQSIYKIKDKGWWNQYGAVFGDECHKFTSVSLTSIMEKLRVSCPFRIGVSGTLKEAKCDKLALEGLFGKVKQLITNDEMIKKGWSSDISISAIKIKYTDKERQIVSKFNYKDEVDYIINNKTRNDFVCKLVSSLEGNTLVLFRFVKKHGIPVVEKLKELTSDVHFVSGKVKVEDRENIRGLLNKEGNVKVVASIQTFGTGINAIHINNIVLITPVKSKVPVLQLIGRGLRKSGNKNKIKLFDIVDDFSWKRKKNYSIKHFLERVRHYQDENFNFKIHNVNLLERKKINDNSDY